MFIAGIDGGGTHTRLELRDGENRFIRRQQFGPFNLNSIGESAFRMLLEEVFAACGSMSDCAGFCVGGAGNRNPRMREILAQELEKVGFRGSWTLCGDQEIALRGAMDGPGAVLIAGTGSICYGRSADGKTAASGGFGHLIDDGGSGYAVARDTLSAAVRACDGRRGGSEGILEAVFTTLRTRSIEDVISFVYGNLRDKSVITPLCWIAVNQAELGDPVALEILQRGAGELAEMLRAVQAQLGLGKCPVAILGGLGGKENLFRDMVEAEIAPMAQPVQPLHDALWGAAQLAFERAKPAFYSACI